MKIGDTLYHYQAYFSFPTLFLPFLQNEKSFKEIPMAANFVRDTLKLFLTKSDYIRTTGSSKPENNSDKDHKY